MLEAAGWLPWVVAQGQGARNGSAWRRRDWGGGVSGGGNGSAAPGAGDGGSAAADVTLVVGHAPTLGRAAALALSGAEAADWLALKKGGIAWLERDARTGLVALRALLSPEELKAMDK